VAPADESFKCEQALLPDKLRSANLQIEGKLTKFQNALRTLTQLVSNLTGMTDRALCLERRDWERA